jgi:MYXO-CTERM domain-containing protein
MPRSLASKLGFAGGALALVLFLAPPAMAAPMQVRFVDVDSASYSSFVGVYGAGFGDTKGQISFGGATSIDVPLWSDGLIIAKVPAGAQTGVVKVTAGGVEAEAPVPLKIHAGIIYVVSTAGSDSNVGDEQNPFQSLHKALTVVQPGDTVLIRAGTYDEQDLNTAAPLPAMYFRPTNGGDAAKPITWRGYGQDVPVIRATQSLASQSPVLYVEGEYLRFARLEINGANNSSSGVSVWASNTWLVGLEVHSFGETGITVGDTSSTMIAGNRIHGGGTRPDLDHGILMLGQGATIRNNEILDLPNGYGIFLQYQTQGSTNVFGNFVHDVAGGGIGLSRVKGGNRIYNNIVWKAGLSQGCRCAVQAAYGRAAGEPSSSDHIYYNTLAGPGFTGVFVADRSGTVEMHGNIFADFKVGIRVDDEGSKTSLSSSHNLWHGESAPPEFKWGGPWLELADFKSQSQQEGSSLLADPKLISPATGDMHLSSISPAIRAGGGPDRPTADYDGVERPSEPDPLDMGALQYTGASGSGGSGGSGGAGGSGGSGGDSGAAGSGAEAGSGGSGGSSEGGSGGSGGADAGKDSGTSGGSDDEGGGCGCTTPSSHARTPWALLLGLAALAWRRRR